MSRTHCAAVLGYVPAVAHLGGKESYVDLYAYDPINGTLRRKKYKLNHIKGVTARKAYARQLVERLNHQLRSGWNPWGHGEAARSMATLEQVVDLYIRDREKNVSSRSFASYRNNSLRFLEWCKSEGLHRIPIGSFRRRDMFEFMDHVRDVRKVNNTTYNNYHLFLSNFWNWAVEREYRRDSPMNGIKRLRRTEKMRTILSPEERTQCLAWFEEHDPMMALVCLFVFHTLLRPRAELRRLRIRDVDLEKGQIRLEGDQTKSKRVRHCAIPPAMADRLRASGVLEGPKHHYVLGKGLKPGQEPCSYNTAGLRWDRMRRALGWDKSKALYSLRDSGIVQLLADGVDLRSVMQQADHKDLATTNYYVKHYFPEGLERVRTLASRF